MEGLNYCENRVENRGLKTAFRARSIPRQLPLNSEMWTEVDAKLRALIKNLLNMFLPLNCKYTRILYTCEQKRNEISANYKLHRSMESRVRSTRVESSFHPKFHCRTISLFAINKTFPSYTSIRMSFTLFLRFDIYCTE